MKLANNLFNIGFEIYFRIKPFTNTSQNEVINKIIKEHVLDADSEKTLIHLIIQHINHRKPKQFIRKIQSVFNEIQDAQLKSFTDKFVKEVVKNHPDLNIYQALSPYLLTKSLEKLISKDYQSLIDEDQMLYSDLELDVKSSEIEKTKLALSVFIEGLVESCVSSLTFFNEGRSPAIPFELAALLGIYQAFAMIPIGITYAIYKCLDDGKKSIALSFALNLTAFLCMIVYFKRRPYPKKFEFCRNFTQEYKLGVLGKAIETDNIAQQMKVHLCPPSFDKPTHICLTGFTGRGKTEKLKALAPLLPDDKQLLVVNTAAVTKDFSNFGSEFNLYLRRIGPHRKNFIIVLDDIHAAIRKSGLNAKTFLQPILDPQANGIAFVVITTNKGYEEYIKNDPEFAGRFSHKRIKQLKQPGIQRMLQEYALVEARDVVISPQLLTTLAEVKQSPRRIRACLKAKVIGVRTVFDGYQSEQVRTQSLVVANLKGNCQLEGSLTSESKKAILKAEKELNLLVKEENEIKRKIARAKFLTQLHQQSKLIRINHIKYPSNKTVDQFVLAHYLTKLSLTMLENIKLPKEIPIKVG